MCGISGIINKNGFSVEPDIIKRMNDLIVHRGPDDQGYYFGKSSLSAYINETKSCSVIKLTL